MKCVDFEARVNDLLDARQSLDGDKLLAAHAADCDACRQDLIAYGLLVGEVGSRPRPLPAADLAGRILGALSAPQVDRPWAIRAPWVAYAVAAAVLVAAFPIWRWWNDGAGEHRATMASNSEINGPAQSAPTPVAEQALEEPAADPPIGNLVRKVGDRYLNLAEETQASYAELALLLPGVRAPESRSRVAPDGEVAATTGAGSRGWVNDMTEGLKPVTNSTVGAFSFLLEALPTEVPAEKL